MNLVKKVNKRAIERMSNKKLKNIKLEQWLPEFDYVNLTDKTTLSEEEVEQLINSIYKKFNDFYASFINKSAKVENMIKLPKEFFTIENSERLLVYLAVMVEKRLADYSKLSFGENSIRFYETLEKDIQTCVFKNGEFKRGDKTKINKQVDDIVKYVSTFLDVQIEKKKEQMELEKQEQLKKEQAKQKRVKTTVEKESASKTVANKPKSKEKNMTKENDVLIIPKKKTVKITIHEPSNVEDIADDDPLFGKIENANLPSKKPVTLRVHTAQDIRELMVDREDVIDYDPNKEDEFTK